MQNAKKSLVGFSKNYAEICNRIAPVGNKIHPHLHHATRLLNDVGQMP